MSVWQGGRASPDGEVPLADDRGLLLGDGLFETVLVRGGSAPLLPRHLARLAASAASLRFPLPDSLAETVARALPALLDAERRPARAALRITVTRGRGRGLSPPGGQPGLVLTLAALPDAADTAPLRARTVAWPKVDPRDPLAAHKVVSAMPRVQARLAAVAAGADVALVATVDGDVCEADAANVFVVVDGTPVTPGLDRGVLPGITRGRCLEALAAAGRPCGERRLTREETARAEEAFLTSSLDGVRALGEIDGRPLPAPGPVAAWLARCVVPGGAP
jgi:branched-subunit amino acid aminotransferase/4-amino-4-deoxychorismate lyase